MGHRLAGGISRWCPELEGWTTHLVLLLLVPHLQRVLLDQIAELNALHTRRHASMALRTEEMSNPVESTSISSNLPTPHPCTHAIALSLQGHSRTALQHDIQLQFVVRFSNPVDSTPLFKTREWRGGSSGFFFGFLRELNERFTFFVSNSSSPPTCVSSEKSTPGLRKDPAVG